MGSGYTVAPGSGGDWTFEFNASALGCPRGGKPDPVSERERTLRKGEPQDEDFVLQHTGRYAAGKAARYLDGVRERVSSCSPREGQSVRIAAQDFAGEESVLVVFDHGGGSLARILLVRKGGRADRGVHQAGSWRRREPRPGPQGGSPLLTGRRGTPAAPPGVRPAPAGRGGAAAPIR
ncbi:hypothetical protein GCM10020358_84420 [Amorphoplanes nipponensis]